MVEDDKEQGGRDPLYTKEKTMICFEDLTWNLQKHSRALQQGHASIDFFSCPCSDMLALIVLSVL